MKKPSRPWRAGRAGHTTMRRRRGACMTCTGSWRAAWDGSVDRRRSRPRSRVLLLSCWPPRSLYPGFACTHSERKTGYQGTREPRNQAYLEYHARVVPWHLGILVPVVSSAWTREPRNQASRVHHVRMVPWSLGILVPVVSSAASNNQLVHSGFCSPDFTGPAEQLTHPGLGAGQFQDVECFMRRIELHQRIGPPVAHPDQIVIVDKHGVGHRIGPGQTPLPPAAGPRIIQCDLAGVPLTDPQAAPRIRPYPPRTLPGGRRLQDRYAATGGIDPGDVVAGERRVVHRSVGCRANAVRPAAPWRVKHIHRSRPWIETSVHPVLAGEPQETATIEGGGVEVRPPCLRRQRVPLHAARLRVDAHDGVEPSVGDPRGPVGPHDHAVRR